MADFIVNHGYLAVFAVALFEFVGLPVPSAALLLYAGSLAGVSALNRLRSRGPATQSGG